MNITAPELGRTTAPSTLRTDHGAVRTGTLAARLRVMIGTLLVGAVLAGCGIRLDSPAIPELSPDADEISRQAMVADAVAIRDEATEALLAVAPGTPEATALQQVVDFSALHVEALGGEYVSGLGHTTTSSDGQAEAGAQTSLDPKTLADEPAEGVDDAGATDGTSVPDAPATSATVVSLLAQSSARARGSLATPVDGSLARLYVSVAASQLGSARDLAASSGTELAPPEAFGTSLPESLPANLSAAELTTLVRSEDSAGYGYEVVAARLPAESRGLSLSRAAAHRDRGQRWAVLASMDQTPTDPRKVAYELPDGADGAPPLDSIEVIVPFAAQMETTLLTSYTTLAGQVEPDERAVFLDMVVDAYTTARAWSAPAQAFPGMPERL